MNCKLAGMSTSKVAILTCWGLLLLLTLFPKCALAGRRVPAPPPQASSTRTSPHKLVLDVPPSLRAGALYDTQFRGVSRHAKMLQWGESLMPPSFAKPSNSDSIYGHRLLVGSSPPTCQGKCGSCNPCNPIHVSIGSPHGALTQQEYYPEVWRCKCGNKLFMP